MKKKEIVRLIIYIIFILTLLVIVLNSRFNVIQKIGDFIFGVMLIGFITEWMVIFIFGRGD